MEAVVGVAVVFGAGVGVFENLKEGGNGLGLWSECAARKVGSVIRRLEEIEGEEPALTNTMVVVPPQMLLLVPVSKSSELRPLPPNKAGSSRWT